MPNRSEERVVTPQLLRDWPLPDPRGDKESRGTVLVVGGSPYNPGAVQLAGVAALRAGAGRLQLAVAGESAVALSIAVPEAKVVGLPLAEDLARTADVIALGPGLDDIGQTTDLMRTVLGAAEPDTAVVLDAYALGALGKDPGLLPQRRAVLTPNLTEAGTPATTWVRRRRSWPGGTAWWCRCTGTSPRRRAARGGRRAATRAWARRAAGTCGPGSSPGCSAAGRNRRRRRAGRRSRTR